MWRAMRAQAAVAAYIRSARRRARCSTGFRRSFASCASAAPSTAAAPAARSIRRRLPSARLPRAWPRRDSSPRCWSASTATTRRSIARPRSSPATASGSNARPWRAGSAARAGGWSGCRRGWPPMSLHRPSCSPTTHPLPVLDPGPVNPRGGRTKTGRRSRLCARRAPLGRAGTAGRRLLLQPRPQGEVAHRPPRRLPGRAAGRWLRRVRDARREG